MGLRTAGFAVGVGCLSLVISICGSEGRAADVSAVWDGSFLNAWSEPARWATTPDVSPVVPTNGAQTFDATINTGNVQLDVSGGVTLNNLFLIDGFLSGDQSLTIVGEAGVDSVWEGAAQNTEIRSPGGVAVGPAATLQITGSGFKALGAPDNADEVEDIVTLTVEGNAVLSGGGQLRAAGEGAVIEIAASGQFDWSSNAAFAGSASGELNNAGQFTKLSSAGVAQISSNWAFNNSGAFTVQGGVVSLSSSANGLNNTGVVQVDAGELRLGGGGGSGTIGVASGATASFNSANAGVVYTFDGAAAELANAGEVVVAGNLNFVNGASLTGAGDFRLTAGGVGGDSVVVAEALDWSGGTIVNSTGVSIPVAASATLSGAANKFLGDSGRLTVAGTAEVSGGGDLAAASASASPSTLQVVNGGLLDIQTDADFTNNSQAGRGALLEIEGTLRKSGGAGVSQIESAWTLANTGVVQVESGTLQVDSDYTHDGAGAIDVDAGATVRFAGSVGGAGPFDGEGQVEFRGAYAPAGLAPVSFGGDVALGEDATLEIGLESLSDFDALSAAGDVSLGGAIAIELLGGYAPVVGATFTLATAGGAMEGAFAQTQFPLAPENSAWSLDVVDQSLVLALVPGLDADFNGDGVVDAADYTVWRDNLGLGDGTPGSLSVSLGDSNNDGLVDATDYANWVAEFGASSAGSVTGAIPEPCGLALLALPCVAGLARRRRR